MLTMAAVSISATVAVKENYSNEANGQHDLLKKNKDEHSKQTRKLRHRRCGWANNGADSRICSSDKAIPDSACGQWNDRYWVPNGCEYDDITGEMARKCLGNRTIAFIGDSMIRDTAVGRHYSHLSFVLSLFCSKYSQM